MKVPALRRDFSFSDGVIMSLRWYFFLVSPFSSVTIIGRDKSLTLNRQNIYNRKLCCVVFAWQA